MQNNIIMLSSVNTHLKLIIAVFLLLEWAFYIQRVGPLLQPFMFLVATTEVGEARSV